MNLNITVHVNANQFVISVPQAGLLEQLPNIIALNKDERICAIGQEAEEMNQTVGEDGWSEKYQARFINPFDFDKYGADYAVAILGFYVHQAFKKMKCLILSRIFYRCDYDIWFWNYESLSTEVRDEFKYLLQKKSFWKIGKISINGNVTPLSAEFLHKKQVEIHQRKIAEFTLRLFNIIGMGFLFWVLYWLIPREIWTKSIPVEYIMIILAVFTLLFFITLIFGGPFLGTVSWMYVMRHYLPAQIMRDVLPSLGFLNKLLSSLANKILGEVVTNLQQS